MLRRPSNGYLILLNVLTLVFGSVTGVNCFGQTFESEPNASFAEATPIFSGIRVTAQLITAVDVDTFTINLPAQGALVINLIGKGSDYTTLSYFDASGTILNSFVPSIVSHPNYTVGVPAAGKYYLRVSNPRGGYYWDSSQYSLTVTFDRLVPQISNQPANQTSVLGSSTYFFATATGIPPLTYQWRKDGVAIAGATGTGYYIFSTTQANAGRYSVVVSNQNGSVNSSEATLTIQEPSKLINLSTLGYLNPDLSSGFVIRGSSSKRIVTRAVGPGLLPFGVTGVVADPALTLYDAKGNVLRFNDDWSSLDASTFSSVGAFGLTAGSRDAAIVATLDPGNYIVSATGFRGAQGLVLLEVYEIP